MRKFVLLITVLLFSYMSFAQNNFKIETIAESNYQWTGIAVSY